MGPLPPRSEAALAPFLDAADFPKLHPKRKAKEYFAKMLMPFPRPQQEILCQKNTTFLNPLDLQAIELPRE